MSSFNINNTAVNQNSIWDYPLSSNVNTENANSALESANQSQAIPWDEVRKDCQVWMNTFLEDFEPSKINKYKIEQLYREDIVSLHEEIEDLQKVYKKLWDESIRTWKGYMPEGWESHSHSYRSWNVENLKYPGVIFKFCSGTPGRGVPAAHFLRVPHGKEIQHIVSEERLDELEVVEESLIALKSQNEIEKKCETYQCYYFVVKSKKIDLLNPKETISRLSSLPQQKQIKIAAQIMRMICRSGLGDVGFHNFNINKETGKLVVFDTEPLYGSLLLDEKSKFNGQYERNDELMEFCTNSHTVSSGLDNMIEACKELPIFQKVAKIYRECFPFSPNE